MPRRTGDQTRSLLLAAALDVFRAHGYAAATLDMIGQEVGITRAAVLHHFGTKDALLVAAVTPLLDDWSAALDRHPSTIRTRAELDAYLTDMVNVLLPHLAALDIIIGDCSARSVADFGERMWDIRSRFIRQLAGPRPAQARAFQAAIIATVCTRPLASFYAHAGSLSIEARARLAVETAAAAWAPHLPAAN